MAAQNKHQEQLRVVMLSVLFQWFSPFHYCKMLLEQTLVHAMIFELKETPGAESCCN